MSQLKFSEDQYIGKQELIRFRRFLDEDGFKKLFARVVNTYGIAFDNLYPEALKIVQGTQPTTISAKAGALVDMNMNIANIEVDTNNVLNIPTDGNTYKIYAKHAYSNVEIGTVSIDVAGNVIGVGTKFTEVLRGQPTNAVKIRFINSLGNTLDYEVLEVLSDTQCIIQAPAFTVETNLKYGVVGSFSPGVVIDPERKMIYNHDYVQFILSSTTLPEPNYLLAEVTYSGGLQIVDKREENKFTLLLDPSIRQNGFIALLNKVQTFTKTQTWSQGSQTNILSKQIVLPDDGNSFVVAMKDNQLQFIQDKPIGTTLTLSFLDSTNLTSLMINAVSNTAPAGYKPILCYQDNLEISPFDTLIFQRKTIFHSDSSAQAFDGWVLVSHSDSYKIGLEALTKINDYINNFSQQPLIDRLNALEANTVILNRIAAPLLTRGAMLMWKRPLNEIPAGWQEVVDWRGRLPMGYDPNQSEFSNIGGAGGSKGRVLQLSNIPPHTHSWNFDTIGRQSGSQTTMRSAPGGSIQVTTTSAGGSGGVAQEFSLLNPYRIVMFIEYVGI